MPYTVVVADDHPVVRAGLRAWLEADDFEVVGEAETGGDVESITREKKPSALLSEVRLPKRDGLECLKRLRDAGDATPTLFLTGHDNPTYVARAVALGAAGLLLKSTDAAGLSAALRRTAAGDSCWTDATLKRYSGSVVEPGTVDPRVDGLALTAREGEVLKQLAFGLSNKEIAAALGISYETVKEHVQHILRKLGVSDRTQAAVWAVRQGLA